MGFYTGYSNAGAAIAGLGRLTAPGGSAASKDAKRVVRAFVRGEVAQGACKGKKDARSCDITSDGLNLDVGDYTLAQRPTHDAQTIKVCVPARGEMTTLKSGKRVEAQKSKDVRATASALLHAFGAGLGVRTDKAGIRRIVGSRGASRMAVPGECVAVKLSKQQMRHAAEGVRASLDARSRYNTAMPTAKQITKSRATLQHDRKVAALERARSARAAKLAQKVAAAAAKEREAALKVAEKHIADFERKNRAQAKKAAARFAKSGRKGWVAASKKSKKK